MYTRPSQHGPRRVFYRFSKRLLTITNMAEVFANLTCTLLTYDSPPEKTRQGGRTRRDNAAAVVTTSVIPSVCLSSNSRACCA